MGVMTAAPVLTIVTPTRNRKSRLLRLLDSLAAQTRTDFEAVIVDDGSTDGTVETLRERQERDPRIRVIQGQHGGPAYARNQGVEAVRGTHVLFLDDDVVAIPSLVERPLEAHERHGARAVVIGPMLPPEHWRRSAWVRWEEEKLLRQYRAMSSGLYPCTARQFFTGNASLPKDLFMAAGGFDTTFRRAEDVELGFRMAALGARFFFEPDASVLHEPERSFRAWCSVPFQYGQCDVRMGRDKHHPTVLLAMSEYGRRHIASRMIADATIGRPWLVKPTILALQGLVLLLDKVGAYRLALPALSLLYHVLYWRGFGEEIGGPGMALPEAFERARATAFTS
jgi:GT2 family glycosyltransferase